MARDPLFDILQRVSEGSFQCARDLERLADELDAICIMLWERRMKKIFGPTLGTSWISHLPQSWFLLDATRSP